MPPVVIFIIGLATSLLCITFVVVSARELKRLGEEADRRAARDRNPDSVSGS